MHAAVNVPHLGFRGGARFFITLRPQLFGGNTVRLPPFCEVLLHRLSLTSPLGARLPSNDNHFCMKRAIRSRSSSPTATPPTASTSRWSKARKRWRRRTSRPSGRPSPSTASPSRATCKPATSGRAKKRFKTSPPCHPERPPDPGSSPGRSGIRESRDLPRWKKASTGEISPLATLGRNDMFMGLEFFASHRAR